MSYSPRVRSPGGRRFSKKPHGEFRRYPERVGGLFDWVSDAGASVMIDERPEARTLKFEVIIEWLGRHAEKNHRTEVDGLTWARKTLCKWADQTKATLDGLEKLRET